MIEVIIPKCLYDKPFVILIATGIHTHAPPPPTRTPIDMMMDIQNLIRKKDTLSLTTAGLLQSDEFRHYIKEQGQSNIGQLHRSFNNLSIIQAMVKRQQLLDYPAGRDWAGTLPH